MHPDDDRLLTLLIETIYRSLGGDDRWRAADLARQGADEFAADLSRGVHLAIHSCAMGGGFRSYHRRGLREMDDRDLAVRCWLTSHAIETTVECEAIVGDWRPYRLRVPLPLDRPLARWEPPQRSLVAQRELEMRRAYAQMADAEAVWLFEFPKKVVLTKEGQANLDAIVKQYTAPSRPALDLQRHRDAVELIVRFVEAVRAACALGFAAGLRSPAHLCDHVCDVRPDGLFVIVHPNGHWPPLQSTYGVCSIHGVVSTLNVWCPTCHEASESRRLSVALLASIVAVCGHLLWESVDDFAKRALLLEMTPGALVEVVESGEDEALQRFALLELT